MPGCNSHVPECFKHENQIERPIPSPAPYAAQKAAAITEPPLHVRQTAHLMAGFAVKMKASHMDQIWKPSLDKADQERLRVECTNFDLRDKAGAFVRPVPLQVMNGWLNEAQPWLARGCGSGRGTLTAWHNAMDIALDLDGYICEGADGICKGILAINTRWRQNYKRMPTMQTRTKRVSSDVESIFNYDNKAVPHISAILHQSIDLDDDKLGVVELMTILQLTALRFSNPEYQHHHIIPVTLASLSDCYVRILCAYFDANTGGIRVWKSPLVDYSKEGSYRRWEWTAAICWLLGEPLKP